jgi:glycosyltransferase involved in cell wall biosynthesis
MNKTTKIAISANTCWYLYNFVKNLILSIKQQGYDVIVIAPEDNYTDRLTSLGCTYINLELHRNSKNPFLDAKTIICFYNIYKKLQPQLALHFTAKNNLYGTLSASLLGIPCVNTISGLGVIFNKKSIYQHLVLWMYKNTQNKARKVVFQNTEDKNLFINNKILPLNKIQLMQGCGVDLKHFTPNKDKLNNDITFLLSARIIYDKGIQEFVQAAKNLKEKYPYVKFQLLGFIDNSHPSAITKNIIDQWVAHGHIEYLGSTDDVREYIAKADVIVLPTTYSEGIPRSLMEAAAMAKPLIATNIAGCRAVVEHNYNGLLCETFSVADLTNKIEQMICMPPIKRYNMGVNSRKKVEVEFDESIIINSYLELIYQNLTISN